MAKRGGFIRNKPQYFIPEQSPEIIFPQLYNNNQLQIIPTPMNKIHRGFDIEVILNIVHLKQVSSVRTAKESMNNMSDLNHLNIVAENEQATQSTITSTPVTDLNAVLIPVPVIQEPPPGSIEAEIAWGKGKSEFADYPFDKFKPYLGHEIGEEYKDKRKIWDKDSLIWFDKLYDYSEIDQYVLPYPKMIETVNSVTTPENTEKILREIRHYLYTIQAHPFNFKYIYRYPVPSVFQDYDKLSHDLALAYDSIDYSAEKIRKNKPIKQLESQIDEFFKKKKLIHDETKEKLMGTILGARKVMGIYKKGKKPPSSDSRTDSFCYLDFDHFSMPRLMSDARIYNSDGILEDVRKSPQYFFKTVLSLQLNNIKDILKSNYNIKILSMVVLNHREWGLDMIRYIREIGEFRANPESFKDKDILKPLPIRLVFRYRIMKPKALHQLRIPAQMIDERYYPGHRSREEFLRLLWDDIAILKLMREVPFREELAPQLWNSTYYAASLDPMLDIKSREFLPNTTGLTTADRRKIMYYFSYYSSDYVMAGKLRGNDSPIIVARKTHRDDLENLDEVGWFVGFEKK